MSFTDIKGIPVAEKARIYHSDQFTRKKSTVDGGW